MIEVSHLSKVYGTRQALKDVSFTLEKGKVYGFLGVNGAGKSTTMNIMTGCLAPTTGTVFVNGLSMAEEPEKAKRFIGYLPELPPVYPDMTVEEYLFFVAELKGIPKQKRKDEVHRVTEETHLTPVRERLIRNLSKGYQQRTGLAQAILNDPEIIILDEPTVGMDPQQILTVRRLIDRLRAEHIVILSSHILSEISSVCDEILILANGRLAAQGSEEALTAQKDGEKLQMTLLAEEDSIRNVLGPYIRKDSLQIRSAGDGLQRVLACLSQDVRMTEEIGRALLQAGIVVTEMQIRRETLEDLFLRVTSQAHAEEESAS